MLLFIVIARYSCKNWWNTLQYIVPVLRGCKVFYDYDEVTMTGKTVFIKNRWAIFLKNVRLLFFWLEKKKLDLSAEGR